MKLIVLAIFVLIMHYVYERSKSDKSKKYVWIFVCAVVVLFVGLRSSRTGADTIGYVGRFKSLINVPWESVFKITYKDPGYVYFIKAITMVTSSEVMYLVIMSFLSFIGVFDLIKRNTGKPVLALFFFVTLGNFVFAFTGMRQAIAMSMCMLSVRYVQERKLIPFLIFVWLGAQIHHSAYLFLIVYFVAVRKIDAISMVTNILITVVAYIFYENLLELANDILDYGYGVQEIDNGFIFYAILLIVIILGFVTRKKWVTDRNQTVIMNLGIFCGIIWTFRLIGRTAERPSMYFLNAIPIVLVNSVETFEKESTRRVIMVCAVILALLFFCLRVYNAKYNFFWNG